MSAATELDVKVEELRIELIKHLGPNADIYFSVLMDWFRMKTTRAEFFTSVAPLFANDIKCNFLHNDFLTNFLTKCQKSVASSLPPVILDYQKRTKRNISKGDEFGLAFHTLRKLQKLKQSIPPSITPFTPKPVPTQNRYPQLKDMALLPDEATLYGRLYLTAAKNGLNFEDPQCAKLLYIAATNFLKNILSAVFTTRSGFRAQSNKYVYGIGDPVPNPWLRHTALLRKSQREHEILFDGETSSLRARPDYDTAEQQAAYEIACCSETIQRVPVSPEDLHRIMKIHKHIIPHHMMYTDFMNRIAAKMNHPLPDVVQEPEFVPETE